jgi:hypothetical protein
MGGMAITSTRGAMPLSSSKHYLMASTPSINGEVILFPSVTSASETVEALPPTTPINTML